MARCITNNVNLLLLLLVSTGLPDEEGKINLNNRCIIETSTRTSKQQIHSQRYSCLLPLFFYPCLPPWNDAHLTPLEMQAALCDLLFLVIGYTSGFELHRLGICTRTGGTNQHLTPGTKRHFFFFPFMCSSVVKKEKNTWSESNISNTWYHAPAVWLLQLNKLMPSKRSIEKIAGEKVNRYPANLTFLLASPSLYLSVSNDQKLDESCNVRR